MQSNDMEGGLTDVLPHDNNRRFTYFPRLPQELRWQIWDYLIPRRIIRVQRWFFYVYFHNTLPPVLEPEIYQTCNDIRRITRRGYDLDFLLSSNVELCRREWFDSERDVIYIPSIRVLHHWNGLGGALVGSTITAKILELVEDIHYGAGSSVYFTAAVRIGFFGGLRTFLLSLLTVEWDYGESENDDIYGDDNTIAFIGLDDKRLPDLLRPVFANLRVLFRGEMTHKRPSCLLRHLHNVWESSLRTLFEEEWIQARLPTGEWTAVLRDSGVYNDDGELFGWAKRRRRTVNRDHPLIREIMSNMPKIKPVVTFEKRYPATMMYGGFDPIQHPIALWNSGRHADGLRSISNRWRLSLASSLTTGRITE
ncbi:hypothetical protein AAE478_010158 [Parahypoxylon ruwenzoriense]